MMFVSMAVFAIKHKRSTDGLAKTDAYIDNRSRLDARFCVKGFRGAIDTNSSFPTARLGV